MYYEAGLKSDDEMALLQMCYLYCNGINDKEIGKDTKKGFEHLVRCYSLIENKEKKDQGVLPIKGFLAGMIGSMYYAGEGVEENPEKALLYLTTGYELHDSMSTYFLSECYKEGFGVKKSIDRANKLLDKWKAMPHPPELEKRLL